MRIAFLAFVAIAACGGPKPSPGSAERSAPEPRAGEGAAASERAPAAPATEHATPAAPATEPVTPAAPKVATPTCVAKPNPAGCPDSEPNVNALCKKNGLECTYGTSCCPPVYVCNKRRFEAHFQSCPTPR